MSTRAIFSTVFALLLLTIAGTAVAQRVLSVPWWSVPAGGGQMTGSSFTLAGSVAQPAASNLIGGTYSLEGGYWIGQTTDVGERVFLPLVVR